ncbi:DEAD/DEAH box helicase [Kouleothrix sp.]|uniref:DEAD/DEAH box helicase n=1 Tax=Kouleothrix sp. TaxID=2779161 RepID=UPI0039188FB1
MITDFAALLRRIPGYSGQIAHVQPLAPRSPAFAEPLAPLPAALAAALDRRGIARLYAHQAAALDAARAGAHIGVVTATASGKTLCYQLPALEAALTDPHSRALFLFPTKALAHDQLRALNELLGGLNAADQSTKSKDQSDENSALLLGRSPFAIHAATLDGDTPRGERDAVRARAQIILSNPDMLHRTLLPDHARWAGLLRNLRFVVLDESHVYRGVFGSHVALIVRRLRRLCAHYGAAPQFICCSATSANPREHLAALVGDGVTLIDGDGAPQGAREFMLWNPPVIDERRKTKDQGSSSRLSSSFPARPAPESGRRRSTNIETASLLAMLVRADVKTLAFTRTRRGAELVLRYTREALSQAGSPLAERVAAYRAGYTSEDRRRLERAFTSGELLGLVSTNALELGVDIGGVDAVVIGGFPGTVASAWQQAGRAGRSQGHSLALLVAQDDPLDQFYMRHPEQFFARPHEHARVALENPFILADQLRCAAAELPLHDADALWFGAAFANLRDWLLRHGELAPTADGGAALAARHPAAQVNIRSADGEPVALRDSESGRTIEQVAATRAPFEVYPGAIYLHQGDAYLVSALHTRHAEARRSQVNYYTQPGDETAISVERVQQQRALGPISLSLGVVEVTRQVTGYKRKEHYSDAVLSEHDLALPPQKFRTIAVWWTVPAELCRRVEDVCGDVLDALHAMEHACIALLPLFAQCDRADIGGLSQDAHPDTKAATIFVYDGVPGGVGIAQVGYEQAEGWWEQTRALLIDCPCAEGCPACIQSPKCGNGNQHLSKVGAAALASLLLGKPAPTASTLPSRGAARSSGTATPQSLIEDLRGRLERARATPAGPRRAALLVALRYRISVERDKLASEADRAALREIEAAAGAL